MPSERLFSRHPGVCDRDWGCDRCVCVCVTGTVCLGVNLSNDSLPTDKLMTHQQALTKLTLKPTHLNPPVFLGDCGCPTPPLTTNLAKIHTIVEAVSFSLVMWSREELRLGNKCTISKINFLRLANLFPTRVLNSSSRVSWVSDRSQCSHLPRIPHHLTWHF